MRYLSLAKVHPELFTNLEKEGFFILLQEEDIRHVESEVTQRLDRKKLPLEWAEVGIVYEDEYLLILRDAVRFPNGEIGTYIRIVNPPDSAWGVVILPIYQEKVLLVRHFRHATRTWHLEIPRGFGQKGLCSEENARRELIEEIGTAASYMISIGEMHVNTGISAECVKLFYARIESVGEVDIKEGINRLLAVEVSELERMILDSEITDSFTIAAYTRAKLGQLL